MRFGAGMGVATAAALAICEGSWRACKLHDPLARAEIRLLLVMQLRGTTLIPFGRKKQV